MDSPQPNFTRILVVSILLSLIFGFVGGGISSNYFLKRASNAGQVEMPADPNGFTPGVGYVASDEAVVKVVKEASPAVVSIIATKDLPTMRGGAGDFFDFFGDFFNPFGSQAPERQEQGGTRQQEVGGGSGFIVSSDGLIITNKHVISIEGADYTVLANDGQRYPAKVLAIDPVQDIAILKIEKNNLSILKLGNSDNLEIGQSVIAIGNALGEFRNTVSVGVISGLRRSVTASSGFGSPVELLEGVIQTDAAINPGNSGGPLLNLAGEVIGINVAVAQGAQNIGFALPVNLAKKDLTQVKNSGKISYPYIGVRYVLVTQSLKEQNNLPVDHGALIQRGESSDELAIIPSSPADKAGLKENDIILEVDGKKVDIENTLAKIIQSYNVGDTVTLKVLSKGEEKNVRVTLGER